MFSTAELGAWNLDIIPSAFWKFLQHHGSTGLSGNWSAALGLLNHN